MKIDKTYLLGEDFNLDEDFNNSFVKKQHYLKHVAKDWTDFALAYTPNSNGYIDDKFPPIMSEDDYEQAANELAAEPAGGSMDYTSPVIGFQFNHNGKIRNVKIRRKSKFLDKSDKFLYGKLGVSAGQVFRDIVVYKIENGQILVITFYIGRMNSIAKFKREYYGELPQGQ